MAMFEAQALHLTATLTVGTHKGGKKPTHSSLMKSQSEGTSTNGMVPWDDPGLGARGRTSPSINISVQPGIGQNRQKTRNRLPWWPLWG